MSTTHYPKIVLSEDNPEIADCNLFYAFVGLYADFTLEDGTRFPFADVTEYADGKFTLSIGEHADGNGYKVILPIDSINTITYI